ncbi:MAG TPA: indole-3-glycerol-phosphate synthase [Spirochaetota bacterium]|nr:indole-3-glycerol-phosphate synthase [Spirochaetota bacterium]
MRTKRFSLGKMPALKRRELPDISARLAAAPPRSRAANGPAVLEGATGIIAEIKKASPSAGRISDAGAGERASRYAKAGAAAISVLTDATYFRGSWDDLASAARAVKVPVLCKEFVRFPEQIDLAAALGADLVLLVARMLSRRDLAALYRRTLDIGIAPLVEVHDERELDSMLALSPRIVMVNTRNLETLAIERDAAFATLRAVPDGITRVCASGIDSADDVRRAREHTGVRLFLVGTALMRAADPQVLLGEMRRVC